jgi:DNA-binding transcriptional ArsR family regulator
MLARCLVGADPLNEGVSRKVIDRIRHDIQHRLDQLLAEAEKLRQALAALDPRERPAPEPKRAKAKPVAKRPARKATAAKPTPTPARGSATTKSNGAVAPARTAPGETKAKVLAALSADVALTAGEVAKATGLARPTVSTTLSKLAKNGEVVKAARGYGLPRSGGDPSTAESE